MKYKIGHFLEWFSMNENSINELPRLRSEKKLFWLHWIQWHLEFYIPGTSFVLLFSQKHSISALYLFRQYDFPDALAQTRIILTKFSLNFASRVPSEKTAEDFEEQIILDIERKSLQKADDRHPTFALATFSSLIVFCRYPELLDTLEIISQQPTWGANDLCSSIFVRKSSLTVLHDKTLCFLTEFDHYIDVLNNATEKE